MITVHQMSPAELIPADYNPRRIERHQLAALKNSLTRWGFVEPVILNETTGRIVGGHQRVRAALELALETVPVVKVQLDETQEKALNIALNKISGEWDFDLLKGLLFELKDEEFELDDLGFDGDELEELLGLGLDAEPQSDLGDDEPEGDLDAIPEAPVEPVTKPGDLWFFQPFFACEGCGRRFSYDEGMAMGEECRPVDGVCPNE